MENFNCDECNGHCEDELYGSFFTGEEWKLPYFDGALFQKEGVWFLGTPTQDCPYHIKRRCIIHDEPFRPIQCIIYPCYLDYNGVVKVDNECSKSYLVDKKFKANARDLIAELRISTEELNRCLSVISKYERVK